MHNAARRQEMAQNISDTSVRMSQGDEGDEDNDDAGNNPPPHPPCKYTKKFTFDVSMHSRYFAL